MIPRLAGAAIATSLIACLMVELCRIYAYTHYVIDTRHPGAHLLEVPETSVRLNPNSVSVKITILGAAVLNQVSVQYVSSQPQYAHVITSKFISGASQGTKQDLG